MALVYHSRLVLHVGPTNNLLGLGTWALGLLPFPNPFPHAARREGEPARRFSLFSPRGGRAGDGGDKHVHDLFVDPYTSLS
jgi:hypothetical protein